nr:TraR/DksA family transcriptional regulator [Klebsiella pneumoniae]
MLGTTCLVSLYIRLVQQRVEEERQRHIHTARNKAPGVSRVLCIDCDAPIPPARRRAIPGVQCCIKWKANHSKGVAV